MCGDFDIKKHKKGKYPNMTEFTDKERKKECNMNLITVV